MAQGTIRIIRNETPGIGGETNGTSGSETSGVPKGIELESIDESTDESSGSQPTSRRHSETKRTTLSVEDRTGQSEEVTDSSSRTTPAPTPKRGGKPKPRPSYMPESEAGTTAKFLLSAVEMTGVAIAGPIGEMSDFERGMMTPALKRILQRTPIGIIERTTPLIDLAFLVMGGAMYFNRISGGMRFPSKPVSKGVQEDKTAPQAAPVERTVANTRAGDVDGIAPPVPSVITAHMNGSI